MFLMLWSTIVYEIIIENKNVLGIRLSVVSAYSVIAEAVPMTSKTREAFNRV